MEYDPIKIFKALSNESRLEILKAIYTFGTFDCQSPTDVQCGCIGDIVERFHLAPSTISHHVKELALAGLVRVERDGQFIRVSPNPDALKAVARFSVTLVGEGEE